MNLFHKNIKNVLLCNLLFASVQASGFTGETQDMTSPRPNTLYDDADDLQRQLDNEAKDRMKCGKVKTIWVFHFPTQYPVVSTEVYRPLRAINLMRRHFTDASTEHFLSSTAVDVNQWDYKDQSKWGLQYPDCTGRSQSPVDLPHEGLMKVTGARQMLFSNHDVLPESLSMVNDGKSVKLSGTWHASKRPIVYGGAAHSRRYVFDSMLLHWPSEHTIGGLQYPMESQTYYISAEYGSMEEALHATSDKMALLGVASLYKFSNHTHKGLRELLQAALTTSFGSKPMSLRSLSYFNPPFKEYVCYQGSLTTPPCTESVLWLIRDRSLPVTREHVDAVQNILVNGELQQFVFRHTQPLNDRKIFYFN